MSGGTKRELRLRKRQEGNGRRNNPQLEDQQRNLLFNLRSAFVQTLQAKQRCWLWPGREPCERYDKTLQVSRDRKRGRRYRAGRSEPAGAAAGAIRIRPADCDGEFADQFARSSFSNS